MTLFNEANDVNSRIRQQETTLGFNGYDHFGPKTRGWRREREIAEMSTRTRQHRKPVGRLGF